MIAKLITTAQTREEAISKMKRALDEFVIEGIKTTIPFHRQLMDHPDYIAGNYTTKFMEDFEMKVSMKIKFKNSEFRFGVFFIKNPCLFTSIKSCNFNA